MSQIIILDEDKLYLIDHLNTQRYINDRESDEGQCNAKGLSLHGKDGVGTAPQQRSSSVKARTHVSQVTSTERLLNFLQHWCMVLDKIR